MLGAELFRGYFKQAREELTVRLCDRLFDADGTKNKWWQVILKKEKKTVFKISQHSLIHTLLFTSTMHSRSQRESLWARS